MRRFSFDADALAGCGALRSTASDLTRAMDSTHRETYSTWRIQVARDWFLGRLHGHRVLQHGGATSGFCTFLVFSPEKHAAVVVLSNTKIPVEGEGADILKWVVAR
jgi:CubicO group peptidase (beta-lactamase class C family)